MNTQNDITIVVGIITIISGIYKFIIEPSIDAKIAALETKGFLVINNFNTNLNDKLTVVDRKLDIHLESFSNYKQANLESFSNYKEANLLQANGLNERINHTWTKTKELFIEERAERKEIQTLIQKQHELKNRE